MDHKERERTRRRYFSNVKSRLGTRLSSDFTQRTDFLTGAWGVSDIANAADTARHRIRNPKLRQYYLKEAAFPSETTKRQQSAEKSQQKDKQAKISATPFDLPEPKLNTVTPTTPVSPSTDAEYDKLVDVEAVPLPDGQLCLLALPPECTQGAESAGLPCLKLFCRFITDRKGVVSGILLVAANKIFFDPYKSLPLVQENGCEEYLFSCPLDHLASVTFFSDVSRVHFSRSTQRWKSNRAKACRDPSSSAPRSGTQATPTPPSAAASEDHSGGSKDTASAERQLKRLALELNTEQQLCAGKQLWGHGSTGAMMFVRMRQKPQLMKKKSFKTCGDAWFILQQESSDKLYAYLSHHQPDLCILEGGGEEDEPEQDDEDFVILSEEEEEEEEEAGRVGRTGDEWEMVCIEDSGVKELLSIDKQPDGLKDIVKQSLILNTQHVQELSSELPPRTVGHSWTLTYSTSKHGASLKTLYRKLSTSDSPVLLLIRDDSEQVFGGFLSHPLHPSDKFYGTGETFLFLLHPRFKCFRWTGENSFFIKGDLDAFAIGGGSGHFGLWLDESLYVGRSSPCYTFNNCSLSENSDFRVLELEAWTFW